MAEQKGTDYCRRGEYFFRRVKIHRVEILPAIMVVKTVQSRAHRAIRDYASEIWIVLMCHLSDESVRCDIDAYLYGFQLCINSKSLWVRVAGVGWTQR